VPNLNGYFEVYTGTTITGELVVNNPTPLKARGVRTKFVGSEYVHWTEQRTEGTGDNRRTVTDHIRDFVTFFEARQTVWQRSDSSEKLAPGQYAWPFSITIPAELPPSFEMHGHVDAYVRYMFTAYVDLPWKFDKALDIFFIVRQYVPAEFVAQAFGNNLQLTNRKTIGCGCCKAGDLQATVQLPSGAICGGYKITAEAMVDNMSTREINNSALCLQRVVRCRTRWGRRRWANHRLQEMLYSDYTTAPQTEGDHRKLEMEFPPNVWQSFQSTLIHVNYHLDFRVRPKRAFDLRLETPIFVLPPAARPLLDAVSGGGVAVGLQKQAGDGGGQAVPTADPADEGLAVRAAEGAPAYTGSPPPAAPVAAAAVPPPQPMAGAPAPAYQFSFQADQQPLAVPSAPIVAGDQSWGNAEMEVGRMVH